MSDKIPKADRQENIKTHEGAEGAVIGRITNFEAGSATRSIEVAVDDIRRAVETDLADSYPSAYLWCDGQTLCVTDHRTPIDGEDVVEMADLGDNDVTIKRTAVVRPSDEAVCALFDRELIAEAIDEIDADRQCVTVHVTPDFALVLKGERAYAVAHMQDTTIESRKGGQLVTDGGTDVPPTRGSEEPLFDSPPFGVFAAEELDGLETTTTTTAVSRPPVEPSSIETVIACLECGEFYEQATDEWERCPVCGDPLYRFEEADGR